MGTYGTVPSHNKCWVAQFGLWPSCARRVGFDHAWGDARMPALVGANRARLWSSLGKGFTFVTADATSWGERASREKHVKEKFSGVDSFPKDKVIV